MNESDPGSDSGSGSKATGGRRRLVILAVVVGLVVCFFTLGLGDYFTLAYLKQAHGRAVGFVDARPVLSTLTFFAAYVVVTGLSLPGAAVMTLAAGALFGLLWGLVVVSFASTLGATIAMLVSRTLLREWVQNRFARQLQAVNEGLAREGGFYLFSVRMVPLFPFFVVNLVMGLTHLSVWQFYWVSQAGMLAGTVVFIFAGTQLARISSVGDVLSPGMIGALTLLGLFPLLARKVLGWIKHREGRSE